MLAHELAHVKNRDTLTMAVAATIGGAVSMFAQYLQFGMLFGGGRDGDRGGLGMIGTLAAVILGADGGRSRADGDQPVARISSRSYGRDDLRQSALAGFGAEENRRAARRIPKREAEAIPAAAHMFIINPLNGHGIDNLFSTHPNVENRIAALEALAREMGVAGARASGDGSPGDR